jgi:glycosyltransferase involved in cell wall biosynthesis
MFPKHVLFVTPWYPSEVNKNLGNFIQRQAHLVAESTRVTVIAPIAKKQQFFPTAPRIRFVSDALTEIRAYYPAWLGQTGRALAVDRALAHLRDFEPAPDLIHAHILMHCAPELEMVTTRFKVPAVATEHWSGYLPERGFPWSPAHTQLLQEQSQRVQCIMPVTHQLGEAMRMRGVTNPIHVVRNHVDQSFFDAPLALEDGVPHLVHLSTLDPNKNPLAILQAGEQLADEGLSFRLTIAGDGPIKPLQRYTQLRGLNPQQFAFLHDLNQEEVVQLMQGKSGMVLFSGYENLPCVIGEAMAAGVPIVSSHVGGIAEVVGFREGILVAQGDHAGLKTAMRRLINDFQANRKEVRGAALEHFAPHAVKQALMEVYQRVQPA